MNEDISEHYLAHNSSLKLGKLSMSPLCLLLATVKEQKSLAEHHNEVVTQSLHFIYEGVLTKLYNLYQSTLPSYLSVYDHREYLFYRRPGQIHPHHIRTKVRRVNIQPNGDGKYYSHGGVSRHSPE